MIVYHCLKAILKYLLKPNTNLPPMLRLTSATGVSLVMLILHLYVCLHSLENQPGDVNPLVEIFTNPTSAAVSYLPLLQLIWT